MRSCALFTAIVFFESTLALSIPSRRRFSQLFATVPELQHGQKNRIKPVLNFDRELEQSGIPGLALPPELSTTPSPIPGLKATITPEEINQRMASALEKMAEKDATSKKVEPNDVQVVYEDDDIVVVNKPAGTLTVPGRNKTLNSLATAVYDLTGCSLPNPDQMVVHRLGMDTSGIMVFCKTKDGVRGMNTAFRVQEVSRQYEALVVGHLEYDEGYIDLPLMRDYARPPYQRISTRDHQVVLADFTKDDVPQKLLEMPKASVTRYEVVRREEAGLDKKYPVTRVILTSPTGRTHQLNVHMAAFGHPIVGDLVYGVNGEALENGGLSESETQELVWNPSRSTREHQEAVAEVFKDKQMCIHAKSISFPHPRTQEELTFETQAPF